jgi:maleamate amidohydrolase
MRAPVRTVPWATDRHCWDELVDDDMARIYAAYRRELGIGTSPAVLAIDLYNAVFAGGPAEPVTLQDEYPSSCGRFAYDALAAVRSVFGCARRLGLPVIHVTFNQAWQGSGRGTNRQTAQGDSSAFDFHPDCRPQPGELIVPKVRASAFWGTPLASELVRLGIDTLVVVGESTSGCVRASVVDAYTHGFHVAVVEDGVFDRSWLNHQVNLFDLHHKYADVMSASTVELLLSADPDQPLRSQLRSERSTA